MKGLCVLIGEQFQDMMLRILCVSAVVSLIVGIIKDGPAEGWMEGVTISFAVFIVVTVSAGNNYMKEKQFASLSSKHDNRVVLVMRDGENKYISVFELTVGDILVFDIGEILPVGKFYFFNIF